MTLTQEKIVCSGGMGKRAWNSGFTGGMGKRAWNSGFTGTKFRFFLSMTMDGVLCAIIERTK